MEEKKPIIFPEGINFNPPRGGVTETLRGVLSFKVKEAVEFLQKHQNETGWVNINMLKSKTKDVIYLALAVPMEWKKPEGLNDAPRASQPLTDLSPAELEIIKKAREAEMKAQEKGIDPEKVFQDF